MQAIEVDRFGGPEVLQARELPDPVPGPGELLIRAAACDVLFVDTMIRSGRGADYFPIRPPYIPGNGVGGTVAAVGGGVDPGWLGREVVAHTGGPGGTGGYADLAVAGAADCTPVPDGVELPAATAVLHDGTTALRVLEVAAVKAGDRVLVLNAAGGMGILLVQLLNGLGVTVMGAARGRAKLDAIGRAGADAAVDYSLPGWTTAALTAAGEPPTVVLDGAGGAAGREAFGLIAHGGRFSAHGTPSGSFAAVDRASASDRGVTVTTIADLQYGPGDRARLLARILAEVAAGRVRPLIGQTFALADAARAHAALQARQTLGKTLLLTDPR